jgi:transcriptional regulator with PAS, ATPase and Fis domain
MPIDLQPKLLRLLENGTYIRVGDTKEQKAQLRLIAATNRNLKSEIDNGQFRSDLYYRVAVFTIDIPALRTRQKDIPALVNHFLAIYTAKTNKVIRSVSTEAMNALQSCEWKGNVRELKNVIERAVILEDDELLHLGSLPLDIQDASDHTSDNRVAFTLASVEKRHIQKVLTHTNGNKAEAARLLDIGIATLYRKIEEYHLK